jgi:hypothetical protein
LCAGDFCAGGFDFRVGAGAELFVEGETDGLDGDVGRAGLLEEGPGVVLSWCVGNAVGLRVPENARGDIASTADGDHEVGLELIEDLVRRFLAQLVDL